MSKALAARTLSPTSTTQTRDTAVKHTFPAASSSATFAAVEDPVLPLPLPSGAAEQLRTLPVEPAPAPVAPVVPAPKVDPADHGLVKMNACAFTLNEFRAMSGAKGLLNGVLIKLLRQRQAVITELPTVTDIAPFRVATPELPSAGKDKLDALAAAFREAGYQPALWYEVLDTFNSASYYFGVMPHYSGDSFALISFRVWNLNLPAKLTWGAMVCSALTAGGFAYTLDDDFTLGTPANHHTCLAGKGADPKKLMAQHAKLLQRVGEPMRKLVNPQSVRSAFEALHAEQARFYVERGLFKPLTAGERALAKASRIDGAYAVHSDVLLEIQRQHGKQRVGSGKLSKLLLLFVSLGLFLFAQKASTTWQSVVMLAAVIFFHELGHFVAMKLCGYRDVKMFFVPFFGAAVTGRKVSVAVWKRAVVALAGPVPGIVLGIVLGGMALSAHNPFYGQIANLLLIINLVNLLPILPLDGGQFMEAVLFNRSPVLSLLFRGVGVAGLLGIYFYTHSGFFIALAVIFALSLPLVYRIAKVAEELRKEGGIEPDVNQTIPPQTAGLIVSRLRAALPAGNNRKTIALYATQVYERVAMPHASRLACVGLLALYAGSAAIGGVFGSVMYAAWQGSLRNVAAWSESRSEHTVDAAQLQAWDGAASCAKLPHVTVAATFPNAADAVQNFNAIKAGAPSVAALRLFGDTVFLMLPVGNAALRHEWMSRLEAKTKGVFVLREGERCSTRFQFVAKDAAQAKQIEEDLNVYFALTQFNVQPPWAESGDAGARARLHAAQLTYYTATHIDQGDNDRLAGAAFRRKIGAASRRGDETELKRLYEEQAASFRRVREQQRAALHRQPWVRLDVLAIVEQNEALADKRAKGMKYEDMDYETEHLLSRQELAPLLGGTAEELSRPVPGSVCGWGLASHEGVYYDIQCLNFDDMAHGAPALVKWLQSRGNSITYTIGMSATTITDVSSPSRNP